jgi:hypothetical protein
MARRARSTLATACSSCASLPMPSRSAHTSAQHTRGGEAGPCSCPGQWAQPPHPVVPDPALLEH